jgi:pyruvate-ferredoxin/flavodoxin oxidoreductase
MTPKHCKDLVKAGYLMLFRYDPRRVAQGKPGLQLDSKEPTYSMEALTKKENRFASLVDLYPEEAKVKHPELREDLKRRYEYYLKLSKEVPKTAGAK